MKNAMMLAVLVAALLISSACSSAGGGNDGRGDVMSGASKQRAPNPAAERMAQTEPDGGIGDRVEAGDLSFRIFEVRSKDRVFDMSKPGAAPETQGDIESKYVAIDYLTKNVSGSPLTTGAEAKLIDDKGNSYKQDDGIDSPSGGTDGMELGTDQTRASTMFFEVPNGIVPETLVIETRRGKARIDLLERHSYKVPPDDYLRVYHLYLNERAYEETYEMFDSATVQDITLGEWLSFWEPRWGKQYVSLDSLMPLYRSPTRATFRMARTSYNRDGDVATDPEIDAYAKQEMVKSNGEWELVMADDLVFDIIAVIGPDEPPVPEATTRESTQPTQPETTAPESTSSVNRPDAYDCTDFETQQEAQFYLSPG